jgi:hypothetical protein
MKQSRKIAGDSGQGRVACPSLIDGWMDECRTEVVRFIAHKFAIVVSNYVVVDCCYRS